jgi:hypothetical protein
VRAEVVEHRSGAQVGLGHPERLLDPPQVVVGGDDRGAVHGGDRQVRDVALEAGELTGPLDRGLVQFRRERATKILESFHTCPIPEVARLGRTLRRWRDAFLAYFTTDRANNGGTEAVNGIIELHRRIARGYRNRDNYRLRMLLVTGGLDPTPPPEVR